MTVRLIAGAPEALVDHPRAERPGLDQVQPNVFGDRWQEGRARHRRQQDCGTCAARRRGQARSLPRLGRRRRSRRPCRSRRAPQRPPRPPTLRRAGVALNGVERTAEDDLRDRAPDVGERGPELVVTQRRIRLPHQHGLRKATRLPDADDLVVHPTTTQPVRSIKSPRPRTADPRIPRPGCALQVTDDCRTSGVGTQAPGSTGAIGVGEIVGAGELLRHHHAPGVDHELACLRRVEGGKVGLHPVEPQVRRPR